MLFVKVKGKDAQKVRNFIMSNQYFIPKVKTLTEEEFILFPINKEFESNFKAEFVERDIAIKEKKDFKQIVEENLSDDELSHLKTAYDHVGSIAILEIDDELKHKEDFIAKTLLEANNSIKTVLKKSGIHTGKFRTQEMIFLAGINTKETIHKENSAMIGVNVEEVYFSPRLATERKRIYEQVKKGEEILVMFCGVAPYPCVLGKNTEAKRIVGIEMNPVGHKFGLENIKRNKLTNVELHNGDVREIIPQLLEKEPNLTFDRILMPLPKTADEFLDDALKVAKKGTIIHMYDFLDEKDFDTAKEKVKKACERTGFKHEIIELIKCGQQSPGTYRICLDFRIL